MSQNNENENTPEIEQTEPQENIETVPQVESEQQSVSYSEQSEERPQAPHEEKEDFFTKLRRFGKAAWAYIKHARIELIVLVAVLVADLVSKAIVNACMDLHQSVQLIPDFLYFTYVHNGMAAFGSAFGLEKILEPPAIRIIFLIITLIAIGIFAYIMYRCRKRHILMRVSLAMILAGALGNFVDRLFLGYVRDFVEIVFFGCDLPLLGTSFAIFNIADMGLTVGVIVFLIYFIVYFKEQPSDKKTAANAQAPASERQPKNNASFTDAAPEQQPTEQQSAEQSQQQSADEKPNGENNNSDNSK